MFWKKKLTPEEELRQAEEQRDKEQETLDHLKDLLEVKIEKARLVAEQKVLRTKIEKPEVELKRRDLEPPIKSKK